jgi:hypothetical protein
MRKIKKSVISAIFLSVIWLIAEVVMLAMVNVKKSQFFSFGPSERLIMPFTDTTVIDTWFKWWSLVMFSIISTCVSVYNSVNFSPWAESVALNPEVKLPHDKKLTFAMVNISWIIQMTTNALTFVYTTTQVDVAFISGVSGAIAYAMCSYEIINDAERDKLEEVYNNDSIFKMDLLPDHTLFRSTDEQDDEKNNPTLTGDQIKEMFDL